METGLFDNTGSLAETRAVVEELYRELVQAAETPGQA